MANTHFVNDPSIADEARLLRMVHLNQIVRGQRGEAIVSSGAFRDTELSVNIEPVMIEQGRLPVDCLKAYPHHKLLSIRAGTCRAVGQVVARDPTPVESAHGIVFGKKTDRIARALRDAAEWVIPENAPQYEDLQGAK